MILSSFRRRSRLIAAFLAACLVASPVRAGISASTAWEVRPGGSDTACSGGFRYGAMIAAPVIPTVTGSGTGGTVAASTYYCVVTYTDSQGETVISAQQSVTTTGTTSTITVTSPAASTGALTWSAYFGTTSGGPYFPQGTGLTIGSNRSVTATPPTTGTQPRGVDYSTQDSAQINVADAVANGTTTVTSATAAFTGSHVGNVAKINGAFYDIVSVTNVTTIVVDRTITTGSSLALIVGGGFATPGGQAAASNNVSSHVVYVKSGTYTILNGTANTATNVVQPNASYVGYGTNRYPGNTDTKPVFDAGANSVQMFWMMTQYQSVENISFTNSTAKTGTIALLPNSSSQVISNCSFDHISAAIDQLAGTGLHTFDSYFNACGSNTFLGGAAVMRCVANSCTGAIFNMSSSCVVADCINVASPNFIGNQNTIFVGCTDYNGPSSSTGFTFSQSGGMCIGCVVWGSNASTTVGFDQGGFLRTRLINCAAGNCTTSFSTKFDPNQMTNCVTLTADPFNNAAGNDFSLNTAAGGGALLRGAGIPGTFPTISTTGHRDIGAVQHADPAGGGFVPGPVRINFLLPKPAYQITRKAG